MAIKKKNNTKYLVWERHEVVYDKKSFLMGVFSTEAKAINAIVKNHEFEPDGIFRGGMLGEREATRKDINAWIRNTIRKSPLKMASSLFIYDLAYQIVPVEEDAWQD